MQRYRVTNIEKGPRGLNSMNGPVTLEVGETKTVVMVRTEYEIAKKSGWFTFADAPFEAASPIRKGTAS